MTKIGCLILAAGESGRFNGCKALAKIVDQTLIERAVSIAHQVCPEDVTVVTGAYHTEIEQVLKGKAEVLYHEGWTAGLGSSIAAGARALKDRYDALIVVLADQIALRPGDLQELIDAFKKHPSKIICAHYANTQGVPALFPKSQFDVIENLDGPHGAREILRTDPDCRIAVVMPNAELNINTREDLDAWLKSQLKTA